MKVKDFVSGFFTICKNVKISDIDCNFSRAQGFRGSPTVDLSVMQTTVSSLSEASGQETE